MLLNDLEVRAVKQLAVRIEVRIHELTPGFRLLPVCFDLKDVGVASIGRIVNQPRLHSSRLYRAATA